MIKVNEIVNSLEGFGAILRVRHGVVHIGKRRRVPRWLIRAAKQQEAELLAYLQERERYRRQQQEPTVQDAMNAQEWMPWR